MNTKGHWAVLVAIIVLCGSCGKEAQEVDGNFVGYWRTWDHPCEPSMWIDGNGDAEYKRTRLMTDCNNMHHSGTARIKGNELCIGTKRLTIDQPPVWIPTMELQDGMWPGPGPYTSNMKVVLAGDVYYKVNEL
jgi:hypothetical protein